MQVVGTSGGGPIFGEERDPRTRALEEKLPGRFDDWRSADALEQREKRWELLQQRIQIEIRTEVRGRCWDGMLNSGLRQLSVKGFLEQRDLFVELHYFGGEGVNRTQVLRPTNALV